MLYLSGTLINKNIKRKKGTGERKPSSGTVKGKGQRTISLQIDGENVLLNMKSRAEVSRHELRLGRLLDSHIAHAMVLHNPCEAKGNLVLKAGLWD